MKKYIIITSIYIVSTALSLLASTAIYMDIDSLAAHADRIWLARLGEVQAHFLDDERRIVSDAELQILDVIKGDRTQDMLQPALLRVSGGVVGDIGQRVTGSARLVSGQRVLVFAEAHGHDKSGRDIYRVVGMSQGLFVVETDENGHDYVQAQTAGLELLNAQGRRKTKLAPMVLPLEQVLQDLRQKFGGTEQ